MDISVSGRNIELTEALRTTAEEKIGRLGRFLEGMDRAEVHFYEEKNPRITDKDVCEVTMEGHGHHVRAKVAAADAFAAVDGAVEKLEHQLHRLKTKLVGRSHPKRRAGLKDSPPPPGPEDADVSRIAKTKQFAMRPMTPDEAVLQMELLGHDFFFFSNADTGRTGVVYRRRSGDIGLIDEAGPSA